MTNKRKLRIYLDTSVFGGCFDVEFEVESKMLFAEVEKGKFVILLSETTLRELNNAPLRVQDVIKNISRENIEIIEHSKEIVFLRDAYIQAGILAKKHLADAEHIACATTSNADFVVSWNFKHIVHYDKIAGFQAVNILNGYKPINIFSPKEVVSS